ncbi:MAG: prepilin-type N-terminal cleavage/methylation domain-containing protein [Methylococcales bacterium]|nr:prepilin-type N-terminal cleavage/methylation domain-containing protein [Methylococcales bacterium]
MILLPPTKQQGFSLLEILIAFSILALSLGILLKIFSAGVNTAIVAEDYTLAIQIAQSKMATIGVSSPLQPASGVENDQYYWQVEVSPYTFNPDQVDLSELTAALVKVKVIVSWGDAGAANDRRVEITSMKLLNKTL